MAPGQKDTLLELTSKATPLVLPNNCTWNDQTEEYKWNPNVERKTLDVQQRALDQLKKIKGDVCVVSIAGPCRQGKSYILSKVFDQGQVFPLGHELDPETMGIWMWITPKKFQDSNGREFTVILLDSEGIDATSSEGSDDHSIFTLSVLLSSIMIYNSGRPSRSDLEGLDCIAKLSQRIQLHTKATEQDDKHFYEVFPYFIWLLRDVVLSLPAGYSTIKDYLIKNILNDKGKRHTDQSRMAAESIMTLFSGFDGFSLPPPAFNPEVIKKLDEENVKSQINPVFRRHIEELKTFLYSKLSPKKSIDEGEFVTGEALAVLVELYVEALNTPGTVPNVQNAWNTFVKDKCSRVLGEVLEEYEDVMKSQVENKLPCEADEIRAVHDEEMEKCLNLLHNETSSLSIKSMDKYLEEFTEKTNSMLSNWLEKNRQETEKYCIQLIKELKGTIFDPVLARLKSPEGSKMEFNMIIDAINKIDQQYAIEARGAKDVQATVFTDFQPEIENEMNQNIDRMRMLKDFDEDGMKADKDAKEEQLEEQRSMVKEENVRLKESHKRTLERQHTLLLEKKEEVVKRLQEILEKNAKDQKEHMANMMHANFEEQKKDREAILDKQRTLEEVTKVMESSLEERVRQIKQLEQKVNDLIKQGDNEADLKREVQYKEREIQDLKVKLAEAQIHDDEKYQIIKELTLRIKRLEEEVNKLTCRLAQMEGDNAQMEKRLAKVEREYETHTHMLILGEMCRKLQENVYRCVFPGIVIEEWNSYIYKITQIDEYIDKNKTLTNQEKSEARKRWKEIEKTLKLDCKRRGVIRSMQKLRNQNAHPDIPEITGELNQALADAVEVLSKRQKGKFFKSYGSSNEEIKELIKILEKTEEMVNEKQQQH